jgi:ferritin-like metal-binding protein YciE
MVAVLRRASSVRVLEATAAQPNGVAGRLGFTAHVAFPLLREWSRRDPRRRNNAERICECRRYDTAKRWVEAAASGGNAMGLFSKDIKTMEDLFQHGLKDIYYAENRILQALPKLIEKATNRDLAKGLRDHLEETKSQVGRLDQVFKKLGHRPEGVRCPAIDGLISEADELAGEVADKQVLDAAVVGSAQAVEHYEIARYGTLIAWAEELGDDDVVRLLTTNLNEEKAADKKLSNVALRKGVNRRAAS